jgi:adenylate cyclase
VPLKGIRTFFSEARRRKVYTSALAYIVIGAGIIQVVEPLTQNLNLPEWTPRLVIVLLILGLPLVLVLAWTFDVTTEGVKRTPPVDRAGSAGGTSKRGAPAPPRGTARTQQPIPELVPRGRKPRVGPGVEEAAADAAPPDPLRVQKAALGHMRHELRTPINGILGYTEMVLEEAADQPFAPDLRRIREAGDRLLSLVDEILSPDSLDTESDGDLAAFGERIRADLRTPINAVIGYSEMVMEAAQEEDREDLLPDLGRVRSAARRLLELSEDIVQAARLVPGSGGEAGDPGALNESSQLARDVLAKLRPLRSGGVGSRIEGEGRILVVDDNAMNRDLLTRGLARSGYMVTEAGDGAEALALLEEQSFDVVLLDLIMPGMDGVEALTRIRGDERLVDLPVVMLSSLDELDSVVRCLELGAEEYLAKPVPGPVLEARIAANVELRRMRALTRTYHDRVQADEDFIQTILAGGFPARFAERVRNGERHVEELYPEVTALCCVFGRGAFDPSRIQPVYEPVEGLAAEMGVEMTLWRPGKFVAMAGAPGEEPGHAGRMAGLALALRAQLEEADAGLPCRFGLHTGPAAGGILGEERFRFELWGEAVDLAEGAALQAPGSGIVVTPPTHAELRDAFGFVPKGIVELPGRGQMRMYLLGDPVEA